MPEQGRKNTVDVLSNLLNSSDFMRFFESSSEDFVDEPFCDYVSRLCEAVNISKSDMISRSGIERTYAYQIFRGTRMPTRDKVIQMAFGFGLDIDGAQALLRAAKHNQLYPRIKRDAAVIFSLNNGLSFVQVQSLLSEIGEKLLGGEQNI